MTEEPKEDFQEIARVKRTPGGWSIAVNVAVIAALGGLLFETRKTSDSVTKFEVFAATATETLRHLSARVEGLSNESEAHRRELLEQNAKLATIQAKQEMVIERLIRLEMNGK